jgi:prolyl oligopeptidase PreP (S9A serine peptidase family)
MLEKKQNVFDDFIAVAEYLVKGKYTSPRKLAIIGGSNGGLLVGAVMEQRPELYAAALPAVGVMDSCATISLPGDELGSRNMDRHLNPNSSNT